jgi:hypothetical protein
MISAIFRYFRLAPDRGDSYGKLNCGHGVSAIVLEAVKYIRLSANKKQLNDKVLLCIGQYFGIGR